jgi:hypothetical protein
MPLAAGDSCPLQAYTRGLGRKIRVCTGLRQNCIAPDSRRLPIHRTSETRPHNVQPCEAAGGGAKEGATGTSSRHGSSSMATHT